MQEAKVELDDKAFGRSGLTAAIRSVAAFSLQGRTLTDMDGPNRTFTVSLYRCDVARHSGLSLQMQSRADDELVVCGLCRRSLGLR